MSRLKLKDIATTAPKKVNKETIKKENTKLQFRMEELQNLLYAQGKYSVLVILQGMDASGKDGVTRNVFEAVNPQGCRVFSFKKPTEIEMKHNFLWRINKVTPEKGMIHIFNRSHYEDVLIQRVHKWVDEDEIKRRFTQINNFEKLLTETNTIVLKFYLHISPEEQLIRLTERLTDPTKNWKHNETDLQERNYWNEYRKAYEDAISNCCDVPWHIIPADQNWYKEHLISKTVVEAMEKLKMQYPVMDKALLKKALEANKEAQSK